LRSQTTASMAAPGSSIYPRYAPCIPPGTTVTFRTPFEDMHYTCFRSYTPCTFCTSTRTTTNTYCIRFSHSRSGISCEAIFRSIKTSRRSVMLPRYDIRKRRVGCLLDEGTTRNYGKRFRYSSRTTLYRRVPTAGCVTSIVLTTHGIMKLRGERATLSQSRPVPWIVCTSASRR